MISTLNLGVAALKELEMSEREPFYKQKFNWLKTITGTVYHIYANLFFNVIFTLTPSFLPDLSKYCQSQSIKNFNKIGRASTLFQYGSRLIDFSVNRTSTVSENASNQEEELTAIKRNYQLQDLYWPARGHTRIDSSKLKQLATRQGCCAGISSHFILCYLNQIQLGKSPIEAIYKIAPLYADEIPKTAEIAQIFEGATHLILPIELIISLTADSPRCNISPIPLLQPQNFMSGSELIMGLTAERQFRTTKLNETEKELTELTQTLPDGIYNVVLNGKKASHALVLIKTDQQSYFLFDPNSGTIISDQNQVGKDLWDIANRMYPSSKGSCEITFNQSRLR
jgi:hypothetical protein